MGLYLQLQTGDEGYLLEAARIAHVLPMLQIKRLPGTAAGVTGIVNYQGAPVPVLDLCELFLGRPATAHLSTRLILISAAACDAVGTSGSDRLVGLLAEKVSDTIRLGAHDFISQEIRSEGASYLGAMTHAHGRLWQRIDLRKLLSANMIGTLCGDPDQPG
jgi:chemotaxis-related protein WspB